MLLFLAIVGGLLSIWLVVLAVKPLVERDVITAEEWQRVEDESMELLNRRDRLLEELRDLEFEAALNKIDPRDLAELKARYEAEAVSVVRELDERVEAYEDRIEADVSTAASKKKRKQKQVEAEVAPEAVPEPAEPESAPCARCEAPLPPEARFCDSCGAPRDAAVELQCDACGEPNRSEARFCKGCGAAMVVEESA